VTALLWLAGAVAAAVGAYLIGWPAWTGYRSREARDVNADRYLAWRGRAAPRHRPPPREGMTGEERRRLAMAAVLAVVSVVCLVAFFATT
jgi:hypothetical protein